MRLPVSGETPTEKTLREFEGWLLQRSPSCELPRYWLVHQWLFEMASRGESARRLWMMDSTPMFCFGALRGTVRLLGDGLRGLVRRWARWTRTPLPKLAHDLELPWVTTKSTKGGLAIDWRDPEARHEVVHRLATDVQRVVEQLLTRRGELHPSHREALKQRGAALLKVIHDDLEADERGRLVIASRSTSDRLVSMTDPEARAGRKSQNQPFKGFKLNVLGDLVSGLIASVKVVPGNCGDGGPGQELLRRAHALGVRLSRVLADTAYGGTEDRLAARRLGIELVAPAPPLPSLSQKSRGVLRKHEFALDFEARRATCPAGVETLMHREVSRGKVMCQQFEWPVADCAACPLRRRCMPKWTDVKSSRGQPRKGRRLTLDAREEALRAARAEWAKPERQAEYRRRAEGERLIARMVRFGGRQALAFGLAKAELQAHAAAMAANLARFAKTLHATSKPVPHEPLPLFAEPNAPP
ncbi:MAG: transposase [Myxococcota bacterium]